ncbi:MAG: DUF922 domain-containing protein [Aestuariivita sp.]|uniref:DUF922 domain-containing protein n=1 Tax=Aestuariivita sp. TaxID=1872407 RepID=UPI003BAF3F1C
MRCWAVIALLASATPAVAGPSVSESLTHYAISGNNLSDLRQEMAQNGPKGFWGYTRWWINWSGSCKVNLEIRITLPKLSASAALTPSEERIWNTMVDALYRHEQMHAEHGRRAAEEIHPTNCSNPRKVVRKWAERDAALDQQTRHGATQGVTLAD